MQIIYYTTSTQRAQTSLGKQIITPILPTVKMLSLGGERLPPSPHPPPKKNVLDHYLHHDLGMLPLLWCCFAHLLILEYPDHHYNLISSSLYYPGPLHKISSQSVYNFLSFVVHRQTDRQTDKQTNATKNITSFAKEVKRGHLYTRMLKKYTYKIGTSVLTPVVKDTPRALNPKLIIASRPLPCK